MAEKPDGEATPASAAPAAPAVETAPTTSIIQQFPHARSLCWFRRAIRVNDNLAFVAAAADAEVVFPLYIIDPVIHNPRRMGFNRTRFLLQSLHDLDQSLKKYWNTRLLVVIGNPLEVLANFVMRFSISRIHTDKDIEPYGLHVEKQLRGLVSELGVYISFYFNTTLYDLDLLQKHEGVPLDFRKFIHMMQTFGPPPSSIKKPAVVHGPTVSDHEFRIPALEELGWKTDEPLPKFIFAGGETEALRRLDETVGNRAYVSTFELGCTNPTALNPDTSLLSCYFSFGCLSAKTYYSRLHQTYEELKRPWDHQISLLSQLFWREFFYLVSYSFPNLDYIKGNQLCRQIDWDVNDEYVKAWCESRTGYPWIDACMSQLRQWGWLHHLSRHSVACFLTRGDLWISWESGRSIFEHLLLDHDWSLNNTNWLWQSGSGFDSAKSTVYHPVDFPKNYDPEGNYIRYFMPVLKDMPAEYIYSPWKAPLSVQQAAKCVVGIDYPAPIVNHEEVVKQNINRMKFHYDREKNNIKLRFGSQSDLDGVTFRSNPRTAEKILTTPLPSITMLLSSPLTSLPSAINVPILPAISNVMNLDSYHLPSTKTPFWPPDQAVRSAPASSSMFAASAAAVTSQRKRANEQDEEQSRKRETLNQLTSN